MKPEQIIFAIRCFVILCLGIRQRLFLNLFSSITYFNLLRLKKKISTSLIQFWNIDIKYLQTNWCRIYLDWISVTYLFYTFTFLIDPAIVATVQLQMYN